MGKKDVIVVGGGPTGIAASIAASRLGANALLIERYGFLGGNATAGLVTHFDSIELMEITGIAKEIYEELKRRKAVKEFPIERVEMPYTYHEAGCGFDPEIYKYVVMDLVEKERVNLLLHSFATGVIKEENQIKGVIVHNKSGRQEIWGKVVVDATGDGDMAVSAGVPYEKGTEDGEMMSVSLCFTVGGVDTTKFMGYIKRNPEEVGYHPRLGKFIKNAHKSAVLQGFHKLIEEARKKSDLTIPLPEFGIGMALLPRKGEFHINATRTTNIDGTNTEDLTRAELSERKNVHHLLQFMRKYIPGFENAYILSTPVQIGVRETRRIKADYFLTLNDIRQARKFEDAIMQGRWAGSDIHSGNDMRWGFEIIEGPYQVPYRCLLPQKVENLLVGGRCIWVEREVLGSLRLMPQCMATGQAAGVAAALSVKLNRSVRQLKGQEIQRKLREQGVSI
ncbi:hypothetical protein ES703_35170 [subsurface metagenome]